MGIHGNATAVMQYDGAKGWLIGEEGRGMNNMFVVMNEARLGTGLQGLAIGTAAYQAAVEFAKDRLQGRSLTGPKNPDGPADSIMVHPDVRRMLLESKAFVEGGQAFILWTALHADLEKSEDEAVATKAKDYMGLLTPVLKAYLTDKGFHVASLGMQVHGGSGYTEHFPASQYLRDARITMIYEGTNGIQALDLVGRKLPSAGGRAIMTWFGEIDAFVAENSGNEAIKPFVDGLADVKAKLQDGTMWLMQNGMAKPGQRRRRLDRLSERLRPDGAGLYVGADGQDGPGQDRSRLDRPLLCDQAADRPLLRRAHPTRRGKPSEEDEDRRRRADGDARRGLLIQPTGLACGRASRDFSRSNSSRYKGPLTETDGSAKGPSSARMI